MRIVLYDMEAPYGVRVTVRSSSERVLGEFHKLLLDTGERGWLQRIIALGTLARLKELSGDYKGAYCEDAIVAVPAIRGLAGWSYFYVYFTDSSCFKQMWGNQQNERVDPQSHGRQQARRLVDIKNILYPIKQEAA